MGGGGVAALGLNLNFLYCGGAFYSLLTKKQATPLNWDEQIRRVLYLSSILYDLSLVLEFLNNQWWLGTE
jgi:hypothetical protein